MCRRLGRENEHDYLSHPPLHFQKIAIVFFIFWVDEVFKIVQLKTPVTIGHVCLCLAIAWKPLKDTTLGLFVSYGAQREIITNLLIADIDTRGGTTHRRANTC